MRRNIFTTNKGFSLLEMSVVMAVVTILTTAIAPVFIKQIEIKAGEKSAQEISIIQESARKYYVDNNTWPATINDLKNGGYINPSWTAANPWGFQYTVANNTLTFSVSNQVPSQWVNLLVRALPSSSYLANIVTSSIPPPGSATVIPRGLIAVWSGFIADIPSGWALCDGTNGTRDLRDKFIIGARQDVGGVAISTIMGPPLQTGGSTIHNHGATTGAHALTLAELPSHHFDVMVNDATSSGGPTRYPETVAVTRLKAYPTNTIGGDQPHIHTMSSDYNVPPFYALAFIQKL